MRQCVPEISGEITKNTCQYVVAVCLQNVVQFHTVLWIL